MKLCIACGERILGHDWRCPKCGFAPERNGGTLCFAPAQAYDNEGYHRECFADAIELREDNFWRVARQQLVLWGLRRYLGQRSSKDYLDIGCGLGIILKAIARRYPEAVLAGTDIHLTSLELVHAELPEIDLFQVDASNLPFESEFDVIGAFDVLEHISDDEAVLRAMSRAVKPGGAILITVPQHPFLWSQRDEHLCHKRRYTRRELVSKVAAAGFRVRRVTSFFAFPLPAMLISNRRNRAPREGYHPFETLRVNGPLNWALNRILSLERGLIRMGVSFPFGGSLFLAADKS